MGLTKVTMGLLSGLAAKVMDIMKDHSNINLGEAKAATGTFVDFSIPEGVKRVTVMFDGVSTNGTSAAVMRIGDSLGISATGYVGVGSYVVTSAQGYTSVVNATAHLIFINIYGGSVNT